jgi:hypothetical protein
MERGRKSTRTHFEEAWMFMAFEQVTRWCAEQTPAGDPDRIEVDCHAMVLITIGESAPPWRVRWECRCSAGATWPIAQLRCDFESREWTLHHGGQPPEGWCSYDDAVRAGEVAPLLDEVTRDRDGRFRGLPPGFQWG